MSEKQAARNSRADFTYLVSWWVPDCDAEALRNMVDWNHWVSHNGHPTYCRFFGVASVQARRPRDHLLTLL